MLKRFVCCLGLVGLGLLGCGGTETCSGATCVNGSGGGGSPSAAGGSSAGKGGLGSAGSLVGSGGSAGAGAGVGGAAGGASGGGSAGSSSGGSIGDPSAPPGSAVYDHGKLSVVGKELRDQSGQAVQLKGVSSMWLNWEEDGYAESRQSLQWMRDNWSLQVIRAAMGIEPVGAYLEDADKARGQVETIVENAIALGLYVIIDWHDHNALDHQAEAEAFFDAIATKYGQYPNVLYETFNEPLELDWSQQLKPYHQALVTKIRAKDPDNVIVLGTPNWSQDVEVAAGDPVPGTNLLYTLHFYACSHDDYLIDKARDALDQNLPLFVTEWGATDADGGLDGVVCVNEAETWHSFLDENRISWTSWKLDGCEDASCLLKEGAPKDGGFGDEWLQGHGPFVRDHLRQ